MKKKSQKPQKLHADKSARPMCAQYSLSDSLLAAFGQPDKTTEISPPECTSVSLPAPDADPSDEPPADTSTVSLNILLILIN